METILLYRYIRPDGGVTVSPIQPDGVAYDTLSRLVASEGKALTQNGEDLTGCVDVDSADGWYEVDDPTMEADNVH